MGKLLLPYLFHFAANLRTNSHEIQVARKFLVCFSLIWFYGISTIVDYLMPYPVFTYISNI